MSDIVERLLKDAESHYEVARSADMRPEDTVNWEHGQNCQEAADTITRLTAEVEWHKKNSDKWQDTQAAHLREVARLTAENEKLRAALRECEAELNAYYRMEYPGSHPYAAGSRIACVKVVIDCEEGEGL
jgi:FtsZ-binding cell division protein ZapB